ncbi:MAG: ACT domain-containing protein [Thermoanaerobaculaceae bacterium]|nr:ACT domain-containing protein [Thermoanaerobaculaceae bacterium]
MNRKEIALEVASILLKHLSPPPPQNIVEKIAADLILLVEKSSIQESPSARLAVLTVIGRNHSGIVHAFSEVLAENNVDIVDINQTIVHGNFAMMMVIDPTNSKVDFASLKTLLKERGTRENVGVFLQYEDLMRELNRI